MRRKLIRCLIAALLLPALTPAMAADDFVIIVNKDNGDAVDRELVTKIYRGEVKSWPAGGSVVPVALPEDNALRVAFDKEVLRKSPSQSKALWAQLTFTGKALPPRMADTENDVVKIVTESKNAIGYVSSHAAGASVKIVK
jgi:ABC-type phosphate transport system substrate-binding protein